MSEAPRACTPHTAALLFLRTLLVVLGTLALLLIVAPRAAHALDVETVDGVVDQVVEPVDQLVGQVEGVVDQVVEPVDQLVGQVEGVVDQVVEPVDQVEGGVDQVAEPVTEPSEDQIEPEVLGGRDQTEPTSTEKAGPSILAGQTPAPAGAVLTESSLSQPTGPSNAEFPTGSPWRIPVGFSSAFIGELETGGHGLLFNAGFLASALLLLVAMSRLGRALDAR
jgi:hypothetical protein